MKKIKLYLLGNKDKENCINEVRLMASLNSAYIIKYKVYEKKIRTRFSTKYLTVFAL